VSELGGADLGATKDPKIRFVYLYERYLMKSRPRIGSVRNISSERKRGAPKGTYFIKCHNYGTE
jgi:hypothetical protein